MAVLKRIKRMRKELAGNPYSSMALAKEAAEAVWPWPYQHLRPIIMGITFCGCVSSIACAVCNMD